MRDAEKALRRNNFQYHLMHQRNDLIGEFTLTLEQFDDLVANINDFIGDSGRWLESLCRQYPATVATFLVHCALYDYTAHTANFWDGVWRRLRIPRNQSRQRMLGEAFLTYLKTQDLPRLSVSGRPYVGQILMHTPIPLDSMFDFFEDVVRVLAEQPALTVADLGNLAWPLQTFIEYGGRLSEDVIARAIDMYRHLERGGFGSVADLREDDDGEGAKRLARQFGVPRLMAEQMRRWFPARRPGDISKGRRMHLRFDPYGQGVMLEIARKDVTHWADKVRSFTLEVDGDKYPLDLNGALGEFRLAPFGGDKDPNKIAFPAPEPGARYDLIGEEKRRALTCRGVEMDGPTYFNPRTGRRLGAGPLPAGDVWALAPKGWTVVSGDGRPQSEPRPEADEGDTSPHAAGRPPQPMALKRSVIVEYLPDLPASWREYRAFGLNTEGLTHLQWFDPSGNLATKWEQGVEPHAGIHPRLVGDQKFAPWLVSDRENGAVYLNAAPRLWLPIRMERPGNLQRWSIKCARSFRLDEPTGVDEIGQNEEDVVFEYALADLEHLLLTSENGVELALESEGLLADMFGDFLLTVHGPLGWDAVIPFTLARGINIAFPEPRHLHDPTRGVERVQLLNQSAHELVLTSLGASITTEDGSTRRGKARGRQFVVRPDDHISELILRVRRAPDRSQAQAGEVETMPTATMMLRLRPAEWKLINIDPASAGAMTTEQQTNFDPISIHAESVEALGGLAISLQTFLNGPCRHQFELLADGKPIVKQPMQRKSVHGQRSRVDLGRFAETLKDYTGADIELRSRVWWSGGEMVFVLARIEFDWHVRDLEATLEPYPDGSGDVHFVATWRDVHPPRHRRTLILEDRWRQKTAAQLEVEGSALVVRGDLTPEQLPPGRYTVGFVSQSGWRRKVKRPVRIEPPLVLEVEKNKWRQLFQHPQGIDGWLLVFNAVLDGAWHRVPPMPSLEDWEPGQKAALVRSLVHPQTFGRAGTVVKNLRKLPLVQRLGLVSGEMASAELASAVFRQLAVALAFPRAFPAADGGKMMKEALTPWPALAALAGADPLPRIRSADKPYLWGHLYRLQQPSPVALPPDPPAASGYFTPEQPSRLLAQWAADPERSTLWRRYGGGLESVHSALVDDLPKLAQIVQRGGRRPAQAFDTLQRHLFDSFHIRHHGLGDEAKILTPWAKLAFVCAGLALLQRATAYIPPLAGWFDKHPLHELVPLAAPALYDHYLLLAEALFREELGKGDVPYDKPASN